MFVRRLVLTLLFLSLISCATMRANQARDAYINDQTHGHVYQQSCAGVWPTARQLLFEKGYSVKPTGEDHWNIETEWLDHQSGDSYYSTRYLVQAFAPDPEQCQVHYLLNTHQSNGNVTTDRDYVIEFELIQRTDPESAQRILAGADAAAEQAR